MIMDKLNKKLYDAAKENGCCDEWLGYISKASKEELLDLYKRGIDFSISHPDWFSNQFALENFSGTMLRQHGIHIGEEIPSSGHNGVYVFKGLSYGCIKFDRFSAATLYVMDDCDISIECHDFSNVFVHVYGKAGVRISQDDVAKVYVYKHSAISHVRCEGDIRIRESNK